MVQYLESRGAAELARTMAAEDAQIDLGGFPFIPRFLGGTLTGVTVTVKGASARGGLRVQSVEARMEEVTFDAGEIFALARSSFSTRTRVTAKEPIVLLELGEGDLNDYVRRSMPSVGDVRVASSGIEVRFLRSDVDPADAVRPSEDDLTKPARFIPTVRDRRFEWILTSSSQVPVEFRAEADRLKNLVTLPRFPKGLDPDVSLRKGVIGIEGQGAEVSQVVGEATDDTLEDGS